MCMCEQLCVRVCSEVKRYRDTYFVHTPITVEHGVFEVPIHGVTADDPVIIETCVHNKRTKINGVVGHDSALLGCLTGDYLG